MFKNRKVKTALVIFFTLGFPVLLTFCLKTGENHYKKLPVLGPKKVSESGDTIYHKVRPFTLTNQKGKTVNLKDDLEGDFLLVHFFHTDCSKHCPEIFRKLKSVHEQYKSLKNFKILSITLDPQNDSREKLQDFADKMDISSSNWHFLRGSKASVYNLANNSFLVPVSEKASEANPAEKEIHHSDLMVLVDKKHRIRGYYKGTKSGDFKKLKDEIIVLSVTED